MGKEPEEDGIGGIVSNINDFWTDNFSWDYGRFSPKNILVPTDQKLKHDEERKLQEKQSTVEDDITEMTDAYDEMYNEINYDDHFMHIHMDNMEADASQKSPVLSPQVALMSDSLSPPPPVPLQLL